MSTVIPTEADVAAHSALREKPAAQISLRYVACVLLFLLARSAIAQIEPPAAYFRSYLNDIPSEPLVNVTVTNAVGVSCLTIEEDLPAPATPLDISGDGVYLPAQNIIRWGPYFNTIYTNVSYRLTGLPATYPVNGGSSVDGVYVSPGVTMIPVLSTGATVLPTPPVAVATPIFTITPPGTVPVFNGSFENPALGANSFIYFDAMNAAQTNYLGWIGGGNSTNGPALFSNGSGWGYSTVTNGTQAISLQGTASISQTINFPGAGTFTLNWWAANRPGQTNPAVVLLDGSTVLDWQATNTAWEPFSMSLNIPSAGLHTIGFAGLGNGNTDASVGVDNISITGTNVPASVTIFCPTPGASIYYTINGGAPTTNSTPYSGAIYLTSLSVIWAEAFETNLLPSASGMAVWGPPPAPANVQVTRTIANNGSTAPTVTFAVAPGTNANCVTVMESLPAGLSAINVSDGGSYIASNNVVLWGPFIGANLLTNQQTLSYEPVGLPGTYPVQASWSADGVGGGETSATSIVIASGVTNQIPVPPPQVATPAFTPASGGDVPVSVTITDATPGAVIYYTVDGTPPTENSLPYTAPINLASAGHIWAAAFTNGWTPSASGVAYYGPPATSANVQVTRNVNTSSPSSPIVMFTVVPGTNANCVAVMETLPAGLAAINVSDGGNYIASNNVVLWGPFTGPNLATNQQTLSYQPVGLPGTYPVQASWSVDGIGGGETTPTSIVIAPPTTSSIPAPPIQVPTPVMTPALASSLPVTVAISDSDSGAQIYYTTDGTLPNQSSTPYLQPLTFGTKTCLRAVAYHSGYLPSPAALGEYDPVLTTNTVSVAQGASGNASFEPNIYLTATPQGTNYCYAVVESIPFGVTPLGISGDGIWDPTLNQIRWGPYLDNQPRDFSFNLTGNSGDYTLTAESSFNGYSSETTIPVQVDANYSGSPPITNLAACAQDDLTYNLDIQPGVGVTVTNASGTIYWGDGTSMAVTQPDTTFEKVYASAGTYSISFTVDWSGTSGSAQVSGVATRTDTIQVVTTCEKPQIITDPSNQVVLAGSTAQFNVSAASSVPITYQWYFNDSALYSSADTFATLMLPNVTPQLQGNYLVIVTNAFGSTTSTVASLTVITPVVSSVSRSANGQVTLNFEGLPDVTTRVWASTNLAIPSDWVPIFTNTVTTTNGTWQFIDTNTSYQQRYYRFSTP